MSDIANMTNKLMKIKNGNSNNNRTRHNRPLHEHTFNDTYFYFMLGVLNRLPRKQNKIK